MSVSVKSGRVEWLDILAPVSGYYTRHVANPRLLTFFPHPRSETCTVCARLKLSDDLFLSLPI